jgi:hypothetical protein
MENIVCQIKPVSVDSTDVQDDDASSILVSVKLNLNVSLSIIREKLEKNSIVKMNDTFSFAKFNSIGKSKLAEIAREDEEKMILKNIIDKKSKTLYLKLKPGWRYFKDKLNLEYGHNVTLEKANKRAFTILDCEMNEIIDGYENNTIHIGSKEAKIIKNDLLLIADIDIQNFAKLGVSIGNSNIKNSNIVTNITYNVIEYNKVSLNFKLEPTTEFIEAVKEVLDSKNPRKFKDIIDGFGQFIPKEVILGGRTYFIARDNFEDDADEYTKYTICQASNIDFEKKVTKSLNKNDYSKYQRFKSFGGKSFSYNDFKESDWLESLNDFKYWSCIKIKNPVNIFQLLSENLRKQILSLVGKKILYTNTEGYTYHLFEPGMHRIFSLRIPENILEILHRKDSECSIFATIIDTKEKDIFNCQVVWTDNEDPKLVIHCLQKKFKKRECKLKIMWMIIGYDVNFNFNISDSNIKLKILKNDINLSNHQAIIKPLGLDHDSSAFYFGIPVLNKLDSSNNSLIIGHHFFKENEIIGSYLFSYCLKKKHFVNLPNFTFYTLIISNCPNSDNYGILPVQHMSKMNKLLNFFKSDSLRPSPKFISLYSTENEYGPIFFKQKSSGIKVKYINANKNKRFKKLEYAFFDPKNPK